LKKISFNLQKNKNLIFILIFLLILLFLINFISFLFTRSLNNKYTEIEFEFNFKENEKDFNEKWISFIVGLNLNFFFK
jgi:Na+-transporting methylmalonyl-CoA/oxaloacetate decarboxylase gamma subunit